MTAFYRVIHQTIMSGRVVRYRALAKHIDFEISASREGVVIQGTLTVLSQHDAADVIAVVERAQALVPHLRRHDQEYGMPGFKPFEPDLADDPACVVEVRQAQMGYEDTIVETRERTE